MEPRVCIDIWRRCTVCMVCMAFVAGCSLAGKPGAGASALDAELAASVVYLYGNETPEQLNRLVEPGTVVVWLNKCGEDIRIVFPERKVTIACLNPVSFNSNAGGIYESKILPPGAVASLCFIQPGLYAFTVERRVGNTAEQAGGLQLEGANRPDAHVGLVDEPRLPALGTGKRHFVLAGVRRFPQRPAAEGQEGGREGE